MASFIILLLLLFVASVVASTFYINSFHEGYSDGSSDFPFKSIEQSIEHIATSNVAYIITSCCDHFFVPSSLSSRVSSASFSSLHPCTLKHHGCNSLTFSSSHPFDLLSLENLNVNNPESFELIAENSVVFLKEKFLYRNLFANNSMIKSFDSFTCNSEIYNIFNSEINSAQIFGENFGGKILLTVPSTYFNVEISGVSSSDNQLSILLDENFYSNFRDLCGFSSLATKISVENFTFSGQYFAIQPAASSDGSLRGNLIVKNSNIYAQNYIYFGASSVEILDSNIGNIQINSPSLFIYSSYLQYSLLSGRYLNVESSNFSIIYATFGASINLDDVIFLTDPNLRYSELSVYFQSSLINFSNIKSVISTSFQILAFSSFTVNNWEFFGESDPGIFEVTSRQLFFNELKFGTKIPRFIFYGSVNNQNDGVVISNSSINLIDSVVFDFFEKQSVSTTIKFIDCNFFNSTADTLINANSNPSPDRNFLHFEFINCSFVNVDTLIKGAQSINLIDSVFSGQGNDVFVFCSGNFLTVLGLNNFRILNSQFQNMFLISSSFFDLVDGHNLIDHLVIENSKFNQLFLLQDSKFEAIFLFGFVRISDTIFESLILASSLKFSIQNLTFSNSHFNSLIIANNVKFSFDYLVLTDIFSLTSALVYAHNQLTIVQTSYNSQIFGSNITTNSGLMTSLLIDIEDLNFEIFINDLNCLHGCFFTAYKANLNFLVETFSEIVYDGLSLFNIIILDSFEVSKFNVNILKLTNLDSSHFNFGFFKFSPENFNILSEAFPQRQLPIISTFQNFESNFSHVLEGSQVVSQPNFLVNFSVVQYHDADVVYSVPHLEIIPIKSKILDAILSNFVYFLRVDSKLHVISLHGQDISYGKRVVTIPSTKFETAYIASNFGQKISFESFLFGHYHFENITSAKCDSGYEFVDSKCTPCNAIQLQLTKNSFSKCIESISPFRGSYYNVPKGVFVLEEQEGGPKTTGLTCFNSHVCPGGTVESGYSGASWFSYPPQLHGSFLLHPQTRFSTGCAFAHVGYKCTYCEPRLVDIHAPIGRFDDPFTDKQVPIVRYFNGACVVCPTYFNVIKSAIQLVALFLFVVLLWYIKFFHKILSKLLPFTEEEVIQKWLIRFLMIFADHIYAVYIILLSPKNSPKLGDLPPKSTSAFQAIILCFSKYHGFNLENFSFNQYMLVIQSIFFIVIYTLILIFFIQYWRSSKGQTNALILLGFKFSFLRKLDNLCYFILPFHAATALVPIGEYFGVNFLGAESFLDPRYPLHVPWLLVFISLHALIAVFVYLIYLPKMQEICWQGVLYKHNSALFDQLVVVVRVILVSTGYLFYLHAQILSVFFTALLCFLLMLKRPFEVEYFNDLTNRFSFVLLLSYLAIVARTLTTELFYQIFLIIVGPLMIAAFLLRSRSLGITSRHVKNPLSSLSTGLFNSSSVISSPL
ncbi:hypothetical protein RCL1_007189 [Eukaryota sp. TZLM3-RCL]